MGKQITISEINEILIDCSLFKTKVEQETKAEPPDFWVRLKSERSEE